MSSTVVPPHVLPHDVHEAVFRLVVVSVLVMLRRQYYTQPRQDPPKQHHARSAVVNGEGLLQQMPTSVQHLICAHLSPCDLMSLGQACSELRQAACDEQLWRALFEKRFAWVEAEVARPMAEDALEMPWRLRYWLWNRTWRQRVLHAQSDIWDRDPKLLIHGRFYRIAGLINIHPGGAELLGGAMKLRRDVADLFDVAGHPPRAFTLLESLCVSELDATAEMSALLGDSGLTGAAHRHGMRPSGQWPRRQRDPADAAVGAQHSEHHSAASRRAWRENVPLHDTGALLGLTACC